MYPPCGEEDDGYSVLVGDEHSFRLEVFPEERTTTKREPLRFSHTNTGSHNNSTTTPGIRHSIDSTASRPSLARSRTPTTDQAQSRHRLSDSTPSESRIPPKNSFPPPRYRSDHRQCAETHRDPRRDRASGGGLFVYRRERDGELEHAIVQFQWNWGEAERQWVGVDG